jgi:uncharacterized protein YrzB (UPF0473 family)
MTIEDVKELVSVDDKEFGTDLLTLVDEDGIEHEFEIADILEMDDQRYMALIPIPSDAKEALQDSGELVILKAVEEDGEEFLEAIEDEEEFDRLADIFMERLEDVYDLKTNPKTGIRRRGSRRRITLRSVCFN